MNTINSGDERQKTPGDSLQAADEAAMGQVASADQASGKASSERVMGEPEVPGAPQQADEAAMGEAGLPSSLQSSDEAAMGQPATPTTEQSADEAAMGVPLTPSQKAAKRFDEAGMGQPGRSGR